MLGKSPHFSEPSTVRWGWRSLLEGHGEKQRLCVTSQKHSPWHMVGTYCVVAIISLLQMWQMEINHSDKILEITYLSMETGEVHYIKTVQGHTICYRMRSRCIKISPRFANKLGAPGWCSQLSVRLLVSFSSGCDLRVVASSPVSAQSRLEILSPFPPPTCACSLSRRPPLL